MLFDTGKISFFNNININNIESINNENPVNNNNFITFEPNNFFSISNENSLYNKNDNFAINLAKIINGVKSGGNTRRFFKSKVEKDLPKPFLEKEISIVFKKMKIIKETKIKFIACINKISTKKEEIKDKLTLNPSERRKNVDSKIKNKDKFKAGRKLKNDFSIRIHNKYSCDNLVDKIKNLINISLVAFCNKIIKNIYRENAKIKQIFSDAKLPKKFSTDKAIKDIDKNFIVYKKKGNEILELLNMAVKDYLCNKISSKYTNIPKKYNGLIIKQLLIDDNNKNIFDFLFNHIKIGDFFDIFIYQKKFKDILNYNQPNKKQKQILKNNSVKFSDYLQKFYLKDEIYFQCLVLLIYNFRRYFFIEERRNRK